MVTTTHVLERWEAQSTSAERMCADILRVEGFDGIDPQSPFGGPDGGKDILCSKDGMDFVVACYFPMGQQRFSDIENKYSDDCTAASKHQRKGFIFMCNQHLTPSERAALEKIAASHGFRAIIKGREHLRVVLDSPQGYGIRLRSLGIAMSQDEQAAFFAASNDSVLGAISAQTTAIRDLAFRIDRLGLENRAFVMHSLAVVRDAVAGDDQKESITRIIEEIGDGSPNFLSAQRSSDLARNLSLSAICNVHRLIMPVGLATAGLFRQTQSWLADASGQISEQIEFPPWDKIPRLLGALVDDWNARVPEDDQDLSAELVISIAARFFHKFLLIHPFLDGNGRVARFLVDVQCRELLSFDHSLTWDAGVQYYQALRDADRADYKSLEALIAQAIEAGG